MAAILGQKRGPIDKLPPHTTAPKQIVFENKGAIAKLPSEGTPREQAAKEEAKGQATKKEEAREPKGPRASGTTRTAGGGAAHPGGRAADHDRWSGCAVGQGAVVGLRCLRCGVRSLFGAGGPRTPP